MTKHAIFNCTNHKTEKRLTAPTTLTPQSPSGTDKDVLEGSENRGFLHPKSGESLTYGIGKSLTSVSVRLSPLLGYKKEGEEGVLTGKENQPCIEVDAGLKNCVGARGGSACLLIRFL